MFPASWGQLLPLELAYVWMSGCALFASAQEVGWSEKLRGLFSFCTKEGYFVGVWLGIFSASHCELGRGH